jgi:hypothetical protein
MTLKSTTARGYGWEHQKVRARVARAVRTGQAVCWRCGLRIHPNTPWDLGHDDRDRRLYRGPEHRACNRRTRSHAARRRAPRPPALAFFDTAPTRSFSARSRAH